jgi:hypothetical protein
MECYVSGVGIAADGLPGWRRSQPMLAGRTGYRTCRAADQDLNILPHNERRRTTRTIRLALQAAAEATEDSGIEVDKMPTVFASADGDGDVVDRICRSMQLEGHPVSPTDFHNSVHNAPAGYWSLCTGSRAASTSVSAGEYSFATGLLEAATQLAGSAAPAVLMVSYDLPLPAPLQSRSLIRAAFSVALLLTKDRLPGSRALLQIGFRTGAAIETSCGDTLDTLRTGNPAGQSLPLLCRLAVGAAGDVVLRSSSTTHLRIHLRSC